MSASRPISAPTEEERRRRIRRSGIGLALLALAFYIGFIALSVMRAGG